MSAKLTAAARRDDAEFRARLAPLASEVLPLPPADAPSLPWRRRVIVLGGIAGVAVLGSAWVFSRVLLSHDAAGIEAGPASKAASSDGPPTASRSGMEGSTVPAAPAAMIALLLRRGDASLADGDIIAARLLYERAYGLGSAVAATAIGKTYDIDFLLQAGAHGIRPDQTAAAAWFRKAAALGDPEARTWLARIDGRSRP